MTDLERAREFFKKDVYATETTGIVIEEVKGNYVRCSLKITEKHKNAGGRVMGGAIYTMADFIFAVAANFDKPLTVTAVSQISYIGAAKSDVLIGESKLIKDGRRSCFYEITINDDLGNPVAVVTTNGMYIEQ